MMILHPSMNNMSTKNQDQARDAAATTTTTTTVNDSNNQTCCGEVGEIVDNAIVIRESSLSKVASQGEKGGKIRMSMDSSSRETEPSPLSFCYSHESSFSEDEDYQDIKYFSSFYKTQRNRIMIGILFTAMIIFIIVDTQTNNYVKHGLKICMDWICLNPYMGIFVYTSICFIATVLFIPGLFITLGGAFVFACSFTYGTGIAIAASCVFIGASLGALVSFLVGRYLLRNCAKKMTKKYQMLEAIDSALGTKGFRIMFLLRLSPVIPFNVLNYFAGVTSMTFKDNALSLFGILPGTILFVFVGASFGKITETSMMMNEDGNGSNMTFTIVSVSLGILFALFGVAATAFYARKELNKVLQKTNCTNDIESDVTDFVNDIDGNDKLNSTNIIDSEN